MLAQTQDDGNVARRKCLNSLFHCCVITGHVVVCMSYWFVSLTFDQLLDLMLTVKRLSMIDACPFFFLQVW